MMTHQELQELIKPLDAEDRRRLRELLEEPSHDDPIYHLAEMARQVSGGSSAPSDFAENHDRYIHGSTISHE